VRVLTFTLLAVLLVSCSGTESAPEPSAKTSTKLVATLVSPTDIALEWHGDEPGAAGRVVEFATEPDGTYTVLEFVPPQQTTFTHPDLMPKTPFYYRVRPFSGPTSSTIDLDLPEGDFTEQDQADGHEWAEPRTVQGGPVTTASVRGDSAPAAPTDFKATVMHANGIKFTWTDHAADEAGYLVEVKPDGVADYAVAAVVDPNINSYGLITLPTEKHASFRIRAFYYGDSSNVAHQQTGE
jgi:hypothetical protein